jgi:hypothetical protein
MRLWLKIAVFLLFSSLVFFNCDNFWGYDYDADPIPNSATINGKITNLFTGEPVYDAKVQVGGQSARTNANGEYSLEYQYQSDEDRNKPVQITVSATNYFSYSTSVIIFPQNNFFDATLEYAAPLISKAVLVDYYENDSTYVCQALVKDYQGADEISSVLASFLYWNTTTRTIQPDEVEMTFDHSISANEEYFQTIYQPLTEYQDLIFLERASIVVTDSSGYHNSIIVNSTTPDSLLFPVQL